MKRWLVLLLLITLPFKAVVAVAGLCAPAAIEKIAATSPCPMHADEHARLADDAAASSVDSTHDGKQQHTHCAVCASSCCIAAAVPSMPTTSTCLATYALASERVHAYQDVDPRTLDRPPRTF
ncbi:MAG TPA: hypothetical protein VFS42_12900 [Burkholderiaceae bacterium]|nr:hypothetical protein [Burkholderiaceae bacterium]